MTVKKITWSYSSSELKQFLWNYSWSLGFDDCQNFAGSWERDFVVNWVDALLYMHYFVKRSWRRKYLGKDNQRNLRTFTTHEQFWFHGRSQINWHRPNCFKDVWTASLVRILYIGLYNAPATCVLWKMMHFIDTKHVNM